MINIENGEDKLYIETRLLGENIMYMHRKKTSDIIKTVIIFQVMGFQEISVFLLCTFLYFLK